MAIRAASLACLLVVLAVGCGGGDDSDDGAVLARTSFEEVVAAELRQAGFEAEPGAGSAVRVQDGPNWIDVDLDDPYAHYRADPDARERIVAEAVDEARERLATGLGDSSYEDVRGDIMPLLKAPFEVRTYGFEPARTPFPGRLDVLYAVDAGDAFTLVRPGDLERWGATGAEVHRLAVANLLEQTNRDEPLLCEPSGDLDLCGWASGDGYDATRMIVPALRRQIRDEIGGAAAYAVPMENVFVALPLSILERGRTEELFRIKVERDFQTADDPLSSEVFVERGGRLAPL